MFNNWTTQHGEFKWSHHVANNIRFEGIWPCRHVEDAVVVAAAAQEQI